MRALENIYSTVPKIHRMLNLEETITSYQDWQTTSWSLKVLCTFTSYYGVPGKMQAMSAWQNAAYPLAPYPLSESSLHQS